MTALGLYIHIPWCPTRCIYCDFNTYIEANQSLKERYHVALLKEIRETGIATGHPPLNTIFLGGGTPTTLNPNQMLEIIDTVAKSFTLHASAEITTESNPATLSLDYLRAIRRGGINRLSMGVQSFRQEELSLLSRLHDVPTVHHAVEWARQAEFDNLSLDLIFNLPYQTLSQWEYNLQQAINLNPDHLSIYSLILEAGTPMQRQVTQGQLPQPDDDVSADMYEASMTMLAEAGFEQYEISNWAKRDIGSAGFQPASVRRTEVSTPKLASAHNLIYWRNQSYLGLGAGAFGTYNQVRRANLKRPHDYIKRIETGTGLGMAQDEKTVEAIDRPTAMMEHIMLGLRLTKEGVSATEFETRFEVKLVDHYQTAIDYGRSNGLLEWIEAGDDQRLRLTPSGYLLANQVIVQFIE
ncbi:radical SAM family heme chaperone HemW [Anaerolineales bacterium HSG6]|nr:radical SAM family heme chaperone HemW [Anaerolineales bacterium HSG6]